MQKENSGGCLCKSRTDQDVYKKDFARMLIKKVGASFYTSVGRLRRGAPFFKNGRKNEKKPEKMRRE